MAHSSITCLLLWRFILYFFGAVVWKIIQFPAALFWLSLLFKSPFRSHTGKPHEHPVCWYPFLSPQAFLGGRLQLLCKHFAESVYPWWKRNVSVNEEAEEAEEEEEATFWQLFSEFTNLCGSRQPVIRGRLYPVTIPLQNHLSDDEDLKQPNQECDYEYDEKYSQVAWAR